MKKSLLFCFVFLLTVFLVNSQTVVLNEDFESAPYDLTSSGTIQWGINSRLHVSGAYCDSCTIGLSSTSYLTTNSFSTLGNTSVMLEFKHICKIESSDAAELEYSIDGGSTWNLITNTYYVGSCDFTNNKFTEASYPTAWYLGSGATVPQNTWWKTENFNIGAIVGNQANVKIRFKLKDVNNTGANLRKGWYIDDVKITIAPSELIPPTITLVPVILQDTVYNTGPFNIKAKITDASGIASASLHYSINGGAFTSIPMTVLSVDTFKAVIPAQAYNTRIDYYISATDASAAANTANSSNKWFFTKKPAPTVIVGTGTSTTSYLPCYGYYNYSYSEQIYTADEIGMSGFIDSIFFYVGTLSSSYTMNNQSVYISSTSQNNISSAVLPSTTGMTQIYSGDYTFTGTGWTKIALATPFYYDGSSNLRIVWLNNDGSYASGYPNFNYTSTSPNYMAQHAYSDPGMPSTGTLTYNRPNLKIAFRSNNFATDIIPFKISEPFSYPIPIVGTSYPVKVNIKNLGSDTLTSATINWSVDGVIQTTYSWTGSLLQDQQSSDITIGNVTFATHGNHHIKVWTSMPNGVADEFPANDTIVKNYFACQNVLAGTYTIDPMIPTGGANFKYFSDAIGTLSNCGINGNTIFNIVPGTYDTLLSIPVIPGANSTANVTFQSSTGNANDVKIRNEANSANNNYVFDLNGTKFFNIRNLSIQATNNNFANCIKLRNNCKNIIIANNNISGVAANNVNDDLNLINSNTNSSDTSIIIRNNILNNGSASIHFDKNYGVNCSDISIINNVINNFYSTGLIIVNTSNVVIDTNVISSLNTEDYSSAVNLYSCENINIRMNKIHNATFSAMNLNDISNSIAGTGNITNNFLSSGGSGDSYGLYIDEAGDLKIYHNSINCYSTSTYSFAFFNSYSDDNEIYNNIFANKGNGYALGVSYSNFTSDYNNIYTTGTHIAEYNYNDYNSLSDYQNASGEDGNSVSYNPLFISNSDLHTLAYNHNDEGTYVGVDNDIDGESRSTTTPDIGADEFTPPLYEAGIVNVLSPVGGCNLNMESVEIQIANYGLNDINGNLTAFYSVNGGTVVSEPVTNQIAIGDTLNFTFTTQTDLSTGATDQNFNVKTWISLVSDPMPINDTLAIIVFSLHNPAPVMVTNVTIPYATATTLIASSTDTIQWFADPALSTLLHTGTSFTTPILYDTTIYYVASTSGFKHHYTFDSDLEGWSALTPCSYTSYNWSWNSDGGAGSAFIPNPSANASALLVSPEINVFGDNVDFSFKHHFNTENYYDGGYVVYKLDGGPWMLFTPTSGLYNSSGYFSNDPAIGNCNSYSLTGCFTGTSPTMVSSGKIQLNGASKLQVAFSFSSDYSSGADGWYIDEVIIEKQGCPGQVMPDTVFVTGIPSVDVGPISIDSPNTGMTLSNNETVTVKIKNYGTNAASNIPVSFKVDNNAPVTETIAGPLLPGDTAIYTFASGADLSTIGTHQILAYTSLTGDIYTINDTVIKQVVCNPLSYCASAASYTSDEDIGNVTLGDLNNSSTQPYNGTYTNYSLSVPPANLFIGQSYPVSITIVTSGNFYSGYCEMYIDYNRDGVFTEPQEVAFGAAFNSSTTVLTGIVNIPTTALSGITGMRVVCRESGTAATTTPCGTYSWGETEDYSVLLQPQLPYDAGVVTIDSPEFIQTQSSQVPVVITVKNYGTNPLDSIPIQYSLNGGAPSTYIWNSTLAPNATTQITLPNVVVLPDSNQICARTQVVGDNNTANDNACGYFYGLPPSIIFEDDMENGTLLYTDAPTLWEHGIPTANVINTAHSPVNVWATKLAGNYPNSASGYVYTPNINFSGISNAYFTFYYWIDAEENMDGGFIQYSINNGATWSALGSINEPNGFNWYDSYASGTPAWTKATNGWKPAFIKLSAVAGNSMVKFRFGFKSNTTIVKNGFAIDDIKILGPAVAIDGGVVEIVAPNTSTTTGAATTVTVKIKNFGTDTLTSIPVTYKLNSGFPPQNGVWTGILPPDSTVNYTFTSTYPGPSVNYKLCAFTNIPGDPYRGNDTTCVSFDDIVGIEEAIMDGVILHQNIPNPASTQTEISFTLPAHGACALSICNILGNVVMATSIDGQAGKNSVSVDVSNLEQGIYIYTLKYKDVVLTRRLSVVK